MRAWLKHLFHPHPDNDYRARVLHHDFLTVYLIIAVILASFFKNMYSVQNILGFATDITTQKLLEFTNSQRAGNGLNTLQYNEQLAAAAEKKAHDMFAKNYWAHFAPDGTSPWNFIVGTGYQYEYAGENLAKNFLFSQGVVDAWMDSPSHKENILRREYTEVGFAIVNGVLNGEETTLVVQMFGKPLGSDAPIVAVNANEIQAPSAVLPTQPPTTTATRIPPSPLTPIPAQGAISAIVPPTGVQPQSAVLTSTTTTPLINLFGGFFTMNMVFLLFLSIALIMDLYVGIRFNVIHLRGKHIGHLIFIGFIVISLLVTISKGSIF